MPIKTEIDITSVVPKIRELGKILCLPVIISNNEPLAFKVWNENSQLIEGIPEMHNYIEDQLNKK